MQFGIIFSVTDTWMCQISFFKYGMVVYGENYCPRPELARQFSQLVEAELNVVVQGERRMGKTSFVHETISTIRDMSDCGIRNVGTVTRASTRLSTDEIIYEHSDVWRFTNPFFREWFEHKMILTEALWHRSPPTRETSLGSLMRKIALCLPS